MVKLDICGNTWGVSSWPQYWSPTAEKPASGGAMNALHKVTIAIAMAAAHMAALSPSSHAQVPSKFPTKPIRLLVAYGPGSSADAVARMIGEKMSAHWGQPVVLDNRPGAGGMLAAAALAKAAPDGYTLLMDGGNFSINAALQSNLPYDPIKDFARVARVGFATSVMVAAPAAGAKSVSDLIALAKAQPGKIIFSVGSVAGGPYLSGARFTIVAGIKVVTVSYKGTGDALIEVMSGRSHYSITGQFAALPLIKDGKLLPLAVFIPQRSPALPEVPTIEEILPKFKLTTMGGTNLLAPAGTPRPILHQISKEVARIVYLPDIKDRFFAAGVVPAPNTPEEQEKWAREHIEYLTALVRDAGLKPK
jgi:tripartite-type tricarboxylate transporter receptor subunit TctC